MAKEILFKQRKRWACGLPFTFTTYTMTNDKLIVDQGFINSKELEVRLYRITNISLHRSLIQKMFGLGTIHIDSTDKDLKEFNLTNIKDSYNIKEMLSEQVEFERKRNRVATRELLIDDDADHDGIDDDIFH